MYRVGSRQWRISQMSGNASIEEAWPVVVAFLGALLIAVVIIRFIRK